MTALTLVLLAACGQGDVDTGTVQLPDPPEARKPADTETDCTNGVDDDLDGLVDCLDDACAEERQCALPRSVYYVEAASFQKGSVTCDDGSSAELPSYAEYVEATSAPTLEEAAQCPSCDASFVGSRQLAFSEGELPSWLEAALAAVRFPLDEDAGLGLTFVDDVTLGLWFRRADGTWEQVVTVTNETGFEGMYTSVAVQIPVEATLEGCTAGPVEVGTWSYGAYSVFVE